ncbi:MAG: TolC family protein [bacterium]|nr:TolC family protein [bacterium]
MIPFFLVLSLSLLFNATLSWAADLPVLLEMSKQNPAIQEAKLKVESAKAKRQKVQTLPDPMLEFGYKNLMDGRETSILGQQSFPYPGKLGLMGRVIESEQLVLEQELALTELKLIAETKKDYYTLFYFNKSVEIINRTKDYLDLMEQTAAARYATGLTPQTDILKIQTERSMLQEQLIMLDAQKETVLSRIKRTDLGLSIDTDISIDLPKELDIPKFAYNYNQLQSMTLAQSPMLKMKQAEIAMQSNEVELAKKEFNPDFIASLELMNPEKNFIKEWSAKFGIMVPLYKNKKQKNALLEAEKNLAAQKKAYEVVKQELLFMLTSANQMRNSAEKRVIVYKTTIIPQANLSLESALANYQVGKVDILMVLDNIRTLLDTEQNYYEQVTEYHKAVAELEQIAWIR